jgi:hypothetical protein
VGAIGPVELPEGRSDRWSRQARFVLTKIEPRSRALSAAWLGPNRAKLVGPGWAPV